MLLFMFAVKQAKKELLGNSKCVSFQQKSSFYFLVNILKTTTVCLCLNLSGCKGTYTVILKRESRPNSVR